MTGNIRKGDLVLSTWALSTNPFATPVTVTDVEADGTVLAGQRGYHESNLVVIQRPKAKAKAKVESRTISCEELYHLNHSPHWVGDDLCVGRVITEPKYLARQGRDFGEDCVMAFDLLLAADAEIPSWVGEVTGMVLPDRE